MFSQDSTDGLEFGMSCALDVLLVEDEMHGSVSEDSSTLGNTNIQRPVGIIYAFSNDVAIIYKHTSNWCLICGKCTLCLKGLVS